MSEGSVETYFMTERSNGRSRKRSLESQVLSLVATGQARSRSELADILGVAASSVSVSVQALVESGWVIESGAGPSSGGRRPRILSIGGESNYVLSADIGGKHVRVGVMTVDGRLESSRGHDFDVAAGPEAALDRLESIFADVRAELEPRRLLGVGVALPGPVNVGAGAVDSPSRMPGWHRYPFQQALADRFDVPARIENDANAMALSEYSSHSPKQRHVIMIKAGTALGAGFVIGGNIYEGATGVAGDITHVRVASAGDIPCSCGNRGCLETIASGAAIVKSLAETRQGVDSIVQVVDMVRDADPEATALVRDAGNRLGEAVAAIVNFFNPEAVYLGGVMSTLEPYVAAFRSRLYEGCHPLATKKLTIGESTLGIDAGLAGVGRLALQQVFNSTTNSPVS